ncbi:MAG: N-acetyl sugar amidotransferase [Alphaproteobacteria bacterium]|nr:N-acetyl sugar amidotransferase [Alphaproteobacteria bacterium]
MKYCTRCILPQTHETVQFDEQGVCNICRQAEKKQHEVDWEARGKMLEKILAKYRNKGEYDCIIPFSGGKDSAFQLWYAVKKLNLKPLVVRYNHWGFRPIVYKNCDKVFKKLGVDVLEFQSNWKVVKALMLQSLIDTGDFCWHCHTGVFANTMRIAVRFNIPLVIWGESPAEYRAYTSFDELEELNNNSFNEMINLGINADDMYKKFKGKISKRDLLTFEFPSEEELKKLDAKSIWLGNYIKWDTKENVELIKRELGWEGAPVEGIPPEYDYEKIECRWQGIRDWCKYIKRGHGRTNHLCCIDIRAGRMKREDALKLAEKYDGKRPASLDLFLEMLGLTEDEFIDILQKNQVEDWGFDREHMVKGEELPDMKEWSKVF